MANIFDSVLSSGKKVTINDGAGNLLEIDATIAEEHGLSSQATLHEIEDGSDISDHIIKKGVTFGLSGVVSDDPISLFSTIVGTASGGLGSLVGGRAGSLATGVVGKLGSSIIEKYNGKPSKDAHDIFGSIYENKLLCTIITGLAVYENMAMEDYSAPRSSKTQRSLEFSARFRKIRIVSSETTEIPADDKEAGGVADSDTPKKNIGKQSSDAVNESAATKGSSLLYKMIY